MYCTCRWNSSQHAWSQILAQNRYFCLPHLQSTSPLRGSPSEYCRDVWYGKTRMVWLPGGEKFLKISICFDRIYERDTVTDRQTDTTWWHWPRQKQRDAHGDAYLLSSYVFVGGGAVGRARQRRLEVEKLPHEVETWWSVRSTALDPLIGVVERQTHRRHQVGDGDRYWSTDASQTVDQHTALYSPCLICHDTRYDTIIMLTQRYNISRCQWQSERRTYLYRPNCMVQLQLLHVRVSIYNQ